MKKNILFLFLLLSILVVVSPPVYSAVDCVSVNWDPMESLTVGVTFNDTICEGYYQQYQFSVTEGNDYEVKVSPGLTSDPDLYLHNLSNVSNINLNYTYFSTNRGTAVDSYTFTAPYSGTYYAAVYGYSGEASGKVYYTIRVDNVTPPPPEPPPAPTSLYPTNGVVLDDYTPDLSWSASDANYFHVQIATDSSFNNIVCDASPVNSFNFTPGDQACSLLSDDDYWWRVRAYNGLWSDWSTGYFTIETTIVIPLPPYDSFDSPGIDTSLWYIDDPAGILTQSGGYFHADGPPSSSFASLESTKTFSGDFEFVLDYRDFSSTAFLNDNTVPFPGIDLQARLKSSPGDHIFIKRSHNHTQQGPSAGLFLSIKFQDWMDEPGIDAPASFPSGLLKIVRVGSTVSTSYNEGAGWILLGTYPNWSTDDVIIHIGVETGPNGTFHVSSDGIYGSFNQSPIIDSFNANPASGEAPLAVNLTCTATDPDGDPMSYTTNFGDDSPPENNNTGNFTHTYNALGIYQASCEVEDNAGGFASSVAAVFASLSDLLGPPYDGFDGPSIDSSIWYINDPGGVLSQSGGYLQADGPPNSVYSGLDSKQTFCDDFEFVLAYSDFSSTAYLDDNTVGFPSIGLLAKLKSSPGDQILFRRAHNHTQLGPLAGVFISTEFQDGVDTPDDWAPTSSPSGLLRIVRVGSTITTSYNEGAGWITLGTYPDAFTGEIRLHIGVDTGPNGTFHVSSDGIYVQNEIQDNDGDLLCDDSDPDDDNDGYTDSVESDAGTDPLDPNSHPAPPPGLVTNAGFETYESTRDWRPSTFGDWAGDSSEIVTAENGISPLEGSQMLHFISSSSAPSDFMASDKFQLIDTSGYKSAIESGLAVAKASANFNRVAGDAETDNLFIIDLYAFSGTTNLFPEKFDNGDFLSFSREGIYTDGDPNTWEPVFAELLLPTDTDYIAINIFPVENVVNDTSGVEFDGHYADMVSLSIELVPADSDDDGIPDDQDNCPNIPNTEQRDLDQDDMGNLCDDDIDGDGLTNDDEVNNYGTDPNIPDSDEDGLNDGEEVNNFGTDPLSEDTDDDALPDGWEHNGVDYDPITQTVSVCSDGDPDVNLPSMGADPLRKDIFVEIDWQEDNNHSHKPKSQAIDLIIDSFSRQNINLHVDYGQDVDEQTGACSSWRCGGNRIDDQYFQLGTYTNDDLLEFGWAIKNENNEFEKYNWREFNNIRSNNFDQNRMKIFRYCVFAHFLADSANSGIGRSKSFIVTLAGWPDENGDPVGTIAQQAGTFMHELGHSLGISAADTPADKWHPNYLSVMNRLFQFGLVVDNNPLFGRLTYSWIELPALDERNLNESEGINGGQQLPELQGYGTKYWVKIDPLIGDCHSGLVTVLPVEINGNINWDYDNDPSEFDVEADISYADINQDCSADELFDILPGYNDWANINFANGGIGLGASADDQDISEFSPVECLSVEEDKVITHVSQPDRPQAEVTPDIVRLDWNPQLNLEEGGNLNHYNIYRKTSNTDFEFVASTQGPVFIDDNLSSCGPFIYGVKAVDYWGNESEMSHTIEVIVPDTTPPEINLTVSPDTLWPANHKMVPIAVTADVTDICDPEPVCQITSITSNEPINGTGDGNTAPDWQITGDLTANLRAERVGGSRRRIYTITVECTDATGNIASASTTVSVPHDKGKKK